MTEKVHDGTIFTLKKELCDECKIARGTQIVFYSLGAGEGLTGEKCLSHLYTNIVRPQAAFYGFYLPVTPYFLRFTNDTVFLTIGLRLPAWPDTQQEVTILSLLSRLDRTIYEISQPHRWDSVTEWEIPVTDAIMQLFIEEKI